MREYQTELNAADEQKNIKRPLAIVIGIAVLLVAGLVWFGIQKPELFGNVRDFVITLIVVLLFLLSIAVSVVCFFLAARVGNAKEKLTDSLDSADGKVEELADRTADVLKAILNPFIEVEAKASGFLGLFGKRDSGK